MTCNERQAQTALPETAAADAWPHGQDAADPDHGEHTCKGSGRLDGKKAVITNADTSDNSRASSHDADRSKRPGMREVPGAPRQAPLILRGSRGLRPRYGSLPTAGGEGDQLFRRLSSRHALMRSPVSR